MKAINDLIRALEFFKQNPTEGEFEGLKRDDFISLSILIIQGFPKYAEYDEKELREKFSLDNYEAVLREYYSFLKNEGQDIPPNLKGLVADFENSELEYAQKKPGESRANFRTSLDNQIQALRIRQELITQVVSQDIVSLDEKQSEEIKRIVKEDPEKTAKKLSSKLKNETKLSQADTDRVSQEWVSYAINSADGQVIAPLDVATVKEFGASKDSSLINMLSYGKEIEEASVFMALPYLANEAKKNEPEFEKAIEGLISNQLPEQTPDYIRNLSQEYANKLANLKETDDPVVINPKTLIIGTLPLNSYNFGSRQEILQIAALRNLNIGNVTPFLDTEEAYKKLDVVAKLTTPQTSYAETPVGGFWSSPVAAPARAFVRAGIDELAKTNPEAAASLQLAARYGVTETPRYGVNGMSLSEFRARAIGMDVSISQFNLLEREFRKIKPDDSSWWMKTALAAQTAQLDDATVQALFAGQVINYDAVAPRQNFLTSTFQRGIQQFVGKPALNFVDGAIRNQMSKVAGQAGKKLVATAGGAALKGALTALNAVPLVGPLLGFLGGELLSRALPLIKKYFVPIVAGLGGLIGFVTFGAVGAIGGGIIGAGLAGGVSGISGGIAVIQGGFAALGGAFAAALVLPLFVAAIGIPISVALILFIINSGAYVVPPSSGSLEMPINQSNVASGSCPLTGDVRITTGSYDPSSETGHGGNAYWGGAAKACSYSIPIPVMYPGCTGPNGPGSNRNVCSKNAEVCPYYGYAADFKSNVGGDVVLPFLCDAGQGSSCPPLTWTAEQFIFNCGGGTGDPGSCTNSWGWIAIFTASGNGHSWKIDLNHVDLTIPKAAGRTYSSGDIIGKIPNVSSANHLHVELDIDGIPVKPEFLCTGGGA